MLTWAVEAPASGDVEDLAVAGDEEALAGVAAVELPQLRDGEVALLQRRRQRVGRGSRRWF